MFGQCDKLISQVLECRFHCLEFPTLLQSGIAVVVTRPHQGFVGIVTIVNLIQDILARVQPL